MNEPRVPLQEPLPGGPRFVTAEDFGEFRREMNMTLFQIGEMCGDLSKRVGKLEKKLSRLATLLEVICNEAGNDLNSINVE